MALRCLTLLKFSLQKREMNEAPPLDIGVSVQKGRHRKLAHTTRAILVQVSEIGSSEPNGQSMRDH